MQAGWSNRMHFQSGRIVFAAILSVALLSLGSNSAVAADFKDNNTALTGHIIKLNTGVTLEYVTEGKEDGPPIILLHGGGDSWHSWLRVLPLIPPQYRVYAITLRGHGLSDHPQSGYARLDFAHDIIAFIDQLHIEKPVIAGHSLGTMVAQAIAVIAPDHVSKLVLAGSPARVPKTAAVEEITKRQSKPTVDVDFARDFQFSTVYSPIPADFAEIVVADAAKLQDYVWHGIKVGLSGDHFEDQLSKIQAPTLVLWGEKDTLVTREETDLLLSKVKTATLKVYPNTGHGVHWERPEEFTKDLVEFIQ
jgi:non-heme chloroperoxidase